MSGHVTSYDAVIIGAGPAGLSLACSLAALHLRIAVVERQAAAVLAGPPFDGREIALTRRSMTLLQQLGAWDRIPAHEISPLGAARVLNGRSLHAIRFQPSPEAADSLGTLVPNYLIRRALYETALTHSNIRLIEQTQATGVQAEDRTATLSLADGSKLSGSLIAAADNRFSEMRRFAGIPAQMFDFGKTMMVCRMAHERSHETVATEWFNYGQTIAMLPLNSEGGHANVSSLVLTMPAREIARLVALDPAAFSAEITQLCLRRWGKMELISTRHPYPLVAVYASRFVGARLALVGDAAVGMHPVTAHGFNFGLTSQDILARLIGEAVAKNADIGSPALLRRYENEHRAATRPLFLATNATVRLFTDDRLPARLLRDIAIRTGERLAPMRSAVAARLMNTNTSTRGPRAAAMALRGAAAGAGAALRSLRPTS